MQMHVFTDQALKNMRLHVHDERKLRNDIKFAALNF